MERRNGQSILKLNEGKLGWVQVAGNIWKSPEGDLYPASQEIWLD